MSRTIICRQCTGQPPQSCSPQGSVIVHHKWWESAQLLHAQRHTALKAKGEIFHLYRRRNEPAGACKFGIMTLTCMYMLCAGAEDVTRTPCLSRSEHETVMQNQYSIVVAPMNDIMQLRVVMELEVFENTYEESLWGRGQRTDDLL